MTGFIIANGIVVGAFESEIEKWKCIYNYLHTFHLRESEFEIRTETHNEFCFCTKAECMMEIYRTEIFNITRSWQRGLISERELEKAKLEIRKKWFSEFTRQNLTNNISMLTAEMLAEKSMELSED